MQPLASLPLTPMPLHGAHGSRTLEQRHAEHLPPHTLMERAGRAVAQLLRALHPHAQRVWVACGPGNNGGDGLLAAAHLHRHGLEVTATWSGSEQRLSPDARHALQEARRAGVRFDDHPPLHFDAAIDALLGLGVNAPLHGKLSDWMARLQTCQAPVLCVDLPSGLDPDTGTWYHNTPALPQGPRHTLSLLSLKPGLFMASGRDASGDIWFDDLGVDIRSVQPDALLSHRPTSTEHARKHRHDAHKGSYGDVLIVGGQSVATHGSGMTGAALLAARASIRSGAGRVYVGLLNEGDPHPFTVDTAFPELMFRQVTQLVQSDLTLSATAVCGCGGGAAVADALPGLLARSTRLVLDADALNTIAASPALSEQLAQRAEHQLVTVLTPHPQEAARLLNQSTHQIQAHRLQAAQTIADRWRCVTVLKGSGTVLAAPDQTPWINPTGNALLATAGSGDVLAGMIGTNWARTQAPSAKELEAALESARQAVFHHGLAANDWPDSVLTASDLLKMPH